jgi:muramoyltetrapeptide carboxypeptidase
MGIQAGGAPLWVGARVAVVAPSGIFEPERLEAGLEAIRGWGLVPVEGAKLRARHRFTAGTLSERIADLQAALADPTIEAIWFARGGYGTAQLLGAVDWAALRGRPLIGFSDATAAFAALGAAGLPGGLHAPVLHSLVDLADEASQSALRRLLMEGVAPSLPGRWLAGPAEAVRGPLVGGNLCVLASLAGTPWALRAKGSVLLLEDIGEPAYKIDRLLLQLRQSGALDGVLGVALGTFTRCAPPADADYSVMDVVLDALDGLEVPIVGGLPVGHGAENWPCWMGAPVELSPTGLRPLGAPGVA